MDGTEGGLLVATQLSSLFPSTQVATVAVQTARLNTPLPPAPKDTDPPAEHASFSFVFHSATTGTVLLRILHTGLIVELISLSTKVPPIRFVFPAAVVPAPSIFLLDSNQLHVLAVTKHGSLYRVIVPIYSSTSLWQDHVNSPWHNEYLIKNIVGTVDGLVHAQGPHSVTIGLSNGSLLRLEAEYGGGGNNEEEWTETVFQQGSFFSNFTSFLPTLHSGGSAGSEIISIATHPWPTDIGHVWTLSRDRTLRCWKAKIGCVATKVLPLTLPGRELTPVASSSANSAKPSVLLEAEPRTLLRVFSNFSDEEDVYVLAFIPTPSSTSSGGCFQLLSTASDQLHEHRTIECPPNTAHCHLQDFIVVQNKLYTLWDQQGQSSVETTVIDIDSHSAIMWTNSSYATESELTPAYLEELLLSHGSLTDKFFEAIMRPGMFSSVTLRTAIDQYTESCLSLPGPPPPQLTTTYATLGENIAAVVGCTVNLVRDPQTGALQHTKYWNALKRDWEGFIARCREVERNARWPLSLGTDNQGEIVLVERERVGSVVSEDLPMNIHRALSNGRPLANTQHDLLEILWTLRTKLGPGTLVSLESRLVEITHQEIAFSFADILQDQVGRSHFREELDPGLESWITGRLASIDDLDAATRIALDVIGGLSAEVKQEEEEVQLMLPINNSDWSQALAADFTATSINARYDLSFSLIILLFFLSDQLQLWDPSLLEEVFAVFRGLAMLRYTARQSGGESTITMAAGESRSPDDVVARLRNMQVSRNRTHFSPTYSLLHHLLAQLPPASSLSSAAHRFLDSTGLLQALTPSQAMRQEVVFCEKLRLLGFREACREAVAWLPRTPGVTYVMARLWLSMGRADDASYLLEKLAGCFGPDSAVTDHDKEALSAVLPSGELYDSEFSFYLHVSKLFQSASLVRQEVLFAQLALSVSPSHVDTSSLWHSIIKGYTDLGLYDDAYASLVALPYEKQKRESVAQLVYRMCEDNAAEALLNFNFAGFANEVEDALSFKARNVDPRIRPFYSRILYTWYTFKGDYRNAALTMYQRARKLHDLVGDPSLLLDLAHEELEAYTVAINSLSIIDPKSAWFVIPISPANSTETRKRRKLSKHIQESRYAVGKHDAEVVDLADIEYEYALLSAQLDLVRHEPDTLASGEFYLPPSSIVLRFAQANRFNLAMATARSLKVDMTDLFAHLTTQCLRLSRNADTVLQEDTSDWLLTDKVSSWPGTPAERGWRYLRQSLERHDSQETDYQYSKAALETIFAVDGTSSPPPWLIQSLENHHHEYLIRVCLRFAILESALEHTLSLLKKADYKLTREPPTHASATWLPYTLIDQVLAAAAAQNDLSPRARSLRDELQTQMPNRVKRMQKLSQFSH